LNFGSPAKVVLLGLVLSLRMLKVLGSQATPRDPERVNDFDTAGVGI
jgi:hypothetical protein